MLTLSNGERWIKLLRAYSPVADNDAMQAEHVDKLSSYLDVPKIAFTHPAYALLAECFPLASGDFQNVVLTGTAGDGKTSLCFKLVKDLTQCASDAKHGVETLHVETAGGERMLTLIYDVTAWRKRSGGFLSAEHVAVLVRMAESVFGDRHEFFVLAVNDGQMHELFRSLPEDVPTIVRDLERELISLHSHNEMGGKNCLRLINLSLISSEDLMKLCLAALLDRTEWRCLEEESEKPLFSAASSLTRNYHALNSPAVREKLVTLARVADITGYHLPTRGILCLLANALLGHPKAKDRVIRLGTEANTIASSGTSHPAALHRTLFGENLTANNRRKREIYRFFSMLHIGEETTNDLDELLIYGTRDKDLESAYKDLVSPDSFSQRNPNFDGFLKRYIRGDIGNAEEMAEFLGELKDERRRVFLQASPEQMHKYLLWRATIFHNTREYLEDFLAPLLAGKTPPRLILRRLAAGINRIWTGLLLSESPNEVYLATGLDLTTSPVSDIYLSQLELDSAPAGLGVELVRRGKIPDLVLRASGREFRFSLTLARFEFLCRVAEGAMPSSFSRESCADFMSLKQRCLRQLQLQASSRALQLIEVQGVGVIQKFPIHLGE